MIVTGPMLTSPSYFLVTKLGVYGRSDDTMWGIRRNCRTKRKLVGETALEQKFRMSVPLNIWKNAMKAGAGAGVISKPRKAPRLPRVPPPLKHEDAHCVEVIKEGTEEYMKKQNLVTDGEIFFQEDGVSEECRLWTLAKDAKPPVEKPELLKPCVKVQVFNHNMQPEMALRCFPKFPEP